MSSVDTPPSPFPDSGLGAYRTMPPSRTLQATHGAAAISSALAEQAQSSRQHESQSHKRKRVSPERNGNPRSKTSGPPGSGGPPSTILHDLMLGDQQNDFSQLGQELARHVADAGESASGTAATLVQNLPHMTVPQPTELNFQNPTNAEGDDAVESSFDVGGEDIPRDHTEGTPYRLHAFTDDTALQLRDATGGNSKPAVGTAAWHKVRRDNHKEVERRRRETINEGINELAKIVPGCDKNKGAILTRGVQYITQLKENEKTNIQKWTMEKMCTEQALEALSNNIETLKAELRRANQEKEGWKKRCEEAGLGLKDGDSSGGAERNESVEDIGKEGHT